MKYLCRLNCLIFSQIITKHYFPLLFILSLTFNVDSVTCIVVAHLHTKNYEMNRMILKIEVQAQKRSFILNSPCLLSGFATSASKQGLFLEQWGPEKKYHELRNRFFDLVQTDRKKTLSGQMQKEGHILQ